MLRVFTDFNARTAEGLCWNLLYRGVALEKQADRLRLATGDKVILCQDDDDFDVTATLDFRHVDALGRDTWVADPDWTTIVRKQP